MRNTLSQGGLGSQEVGHRLLGIQQGDALRELDVRQTSKVDVFYAFLPLTVWALFEGAKQEQEVSWNLGEKKKKKIVGKGWEGGKILLWCSGLKLPMRSATSQFRHYHSGSKK